MKLPKYFRRGVPDPLILALALSFLTLILAYMLGTQPRPGLAGVADVLSYWTLGFWDLLSFSMQMVLILLLGYMLALSPLFDRLSTALAGLSRNPVLVPVVVSFVAVVLGLINWGLALVFGAIFVRKIAMQAAREGHAINYPLMGAAAYVCMMIWHGGLSGSAPLSVAGEGHFLAAKTGIIPLSRTVFSPMNITAGLLLLVLIPLTTWWFSRKGTKAIPAGLFQPAPETAGKETNGWRPTLLSATGVLLLAGFMVMTWAGESNRSIGLNEINLILFSLVLIALPHTTQLSEAASEAIGSTAGIIIQFPLYAGIMGIMKYSGLLVVMTEWFVTVSTPATFCLYSFFSASLVNLFVPSGGGQWAVQGPLIVDAASQLGVSQAKAVMALAYGDQLTNMLQPFWALPLLGITGLKAGDIFRYSVRFMLIGLVVFGLVLLF